MATLYTAYSSTGDYTKTRVKIDYTPGQTTATATLLYTRTNNYTGATSATNCTFKFGGASKTFSKSFTGKQTDATVTSLTFTISTAGGTYSGSSSGIYLGGSWSITIPAATYTANFYANSGFAPSFSSKTTTANAAIGNLPTVSRIGHTFLGWYGGARSSYTLSSSTSNYNYTAIYTGVKAGNSYGINIATASLTAGSATQFTTLIYDFTSSAQLAASVQSFGSNKRYMIDCPSTADNSHDIRIIVYAGIAGSTANQAATYTNVSVGPKATTSTVTPAANTYFYAFWRANSYTITYNANGGSVDSTTQSVTYGSTASLKTPTRTGYTFKGWYMDFTGSNAVNYGRVYNYTTKMSVHLEAYSTNWSNVTSQRLVSCTESGGWNIESSDGYVQFSGYDKDVGYKVLKTSKTWASLAAGWHSFDFVFTGSVVQGYIDGTSYGSSAAYTSGSLGYNSSNTLFMGAEAGSSPDTPAGNYFVGRIKNYNMSGSNAVLTDVNNKMRMPAQNITLVAEWEPITITITLDKQGGSGGTDKFYYKYGINKFYSNSACTTEITAITKPTKTGYTFVHYYGDGTCGGTSGERYVAYDSTNFASDLCTDIYKDATLYAQWTINTYTISYNKNGNIVSNVPSAQTKTYGTNITLSSTSPTRTRYNFLGWSTSSTATTATYAPGATFSTNANTTLYAVWQIVDKDIYLYNTGKIDAVDFKTVSTVTELFDKNGYVYGTGFVTHSESNIYIGKDGKIYAKEFIKY